MKHAQDEIISNLQLLSLRKFSKYYAKTIIIIIIHCLKSNIQEAQWTILTTQKKNIKLYKKKKKQSQNQSDER